MYAIESNAYRVLEMNETREYDVAIDMDTTKLNGGVTRVSNATMGGMVLESTVIDYSPRFQ